MVEAAGRNELDFVVASSVGLVTLMAQHRVRPIATGIASRAFTTRFINT
jgi:hypothetical protein